MKQAGPLVLMIVGALILVASIAWPSVFPSSTYWSEVDEAELEEMQSRVHNLSYLAAQAEEQPSRRKPRMSGEEFAEYRELREKTQQRLEVRDNAISRPGFISGILRWSGIATLLAGVSIYYVVREQ